MVPENEFSRLFEIEDLPEFGRDVHIEAKPAERVALARRFGIIRVDKFVADARLERVGQAVRVAGRFAADVVQACVVTLEPVATDVGEDFSILFERNAAPLLADRVHVVDPDAEDIEVLTGPKVDLGEIVAEQLALALPSYPRKPGVEFGTYTTDPDGEKPAPGPRLPFSGLDKLLRKQ